MASEIFNESKLFQLRLIAVFRHFIGREWGGKSWLVEKTGLGSGTVSEWFHPKNPTLPGNASLKKVADALGISFEWLATGKGEMIPGDAVRENAPEYVIDGQAITEASRLVDEMVIQGRAYDENDRNEWISLVAEEIAELRALGRPGEIRRKVRRWIQAAERLGALKSKK